MPILRHRNSHRVAAAVSPRSSDEWTTVVSIDTGGTVISVNPDFERTAGYSRYEILGRPAVELQEGDRDPWFFRVIAETVRSGQGGSDVFPRRRRDGTADEEAAEVHPVCDAMGRITGYAAIKRPLAGDSEVAGAPGTKPNMESVGRLAGGIAHNYNNLLASIIGLGELLLAGMGPDDAKRRQVQEILKVSERGTLLARMLLAFGRGQSLMPRMMDLNALVEAMCGGLGTLIGADTVLSARLQQELGPVHADPGQVERVLINLVVNAREAMPDGGTLAIETANVDIAEPFVRQKVRVRRGRYVMIAVSDTGIGMDDETKARVFEPFFSTKAEGAGLGLSAVYGIVKQSGGYIWVSSKAGNGTTVTIYFPRAEQTADAFPPTMERLRLPRADSHDAWAQETSPPGSA